jgi:septal ring factor EnvC (AmiA/AmiB activator)
MEKINALLSRLDNKVPNSIAKKLDGLRNLNSSLQKAIEEERQNPSEEAEEKKQEIIDFIEDEKDTIIDMLENYIEDKENAEFEIQEEKKRVIAEQKKKEEAKKRLAEEKEKEAEEARKLAEQKQKEEENKQKTETEKKSGIGWGGLIVGGILLVATGGVINYFAKRR